MVGGNQHASPRLSWKPETLHKPHGLLLRAPPAGVTERDSAPSHPCERRVWEASWGTYTPTFQGFKGKSWLMQVTECQKKLNNRASEKYLRFGGKHPNIINLKKKQTRKWYIYYNTNVYLIHIYLIKPSIYWGPSRCTALCKGLCISFIAGSAYHLHVICIYSPLHLICICLCIYFISHLHIYSYAQPSYPWPCGQGNLQMRKLKFRETE